MRDRIAQAALGATSAGKLFPWETLSERERGAWRAMADAVIAELGLKREEALHSVLPDYDRNMVCMNVWAHRYVTEWTADE